MTRIVLFAALACAAAQMAFAPAASAQDAISTRPAQEPSQASVAAAMPDAGAPVDERATASQVDAARWGHEVLDRAAGKLPPSDDRLAQAGPGAGKGCVRNPDRAPHGSVGVSAGSGGYRGADVFMTQPVGDCGQISIGISSARGRGWRY
jgi:hypothetical protein